MKQKETQITIFNDKLLRAHATKIKKWVETVKELQAEKFTLAISITRLTSIKSLCQDQVAAVHLVIS